MGCTAAAGLAPPPDAVAIGAGRRITYGEAIEIAGAFDRHIKPEILTTGYGLLLKFQRSEASALRAAVLVATVEVEIGDAGDAILLRCA